MTYPPSYPSVIPSLSLHSLLGLSSDQLVHLLSLARDEAAASLGSESIMQISTAIRDYLLEHNHPQRSMLDDRNAELKGEEVEEEGEYYNPSEDEDEPQAQRDARREKREAERRAMRGPSPLGIPPGTTVTVASFMEWKGRFDDEQRRIKEEAEKVRSKKDVKMTGKQLFIMNLAKELQDDEAEGLPEEKEEGGKDKVFWYSEGIYADEDVDLPDEEEGAGDEGQDGGEGGVEEKKKEEQMKAEERRRTEAAAEEEKRKEKGGKKGDEKAKGGSTGSGSGGKAAPPPSKSASSPSAAQGKGQSSGSKGQSGGGGKGKETKDSSKAKGKK